MQKGEEGLSRENKILGLCPIVRPYQLLSLTWVTGMYKNTASLSSLDGQVGRGQLASVG